jgi:hypothetical protein
VFVASKFEQAGQQRFNLIAARFTAQTPFAEVLAVVRQQPIRVFAYTGACSEDHLCGIELRWHIASAPDWIAAGEASERRFFHRSSTQAACESCVMHDVAVAYVDPVMQITAARRDNV